MAADAEPDAEFFLRKQLKLRHLRLLLAIERVGTVTAAAASQGVSQVAASRTVAELEAGLGRRLFERRRGGLVATEFCLRMLETSRRIEHEIDCLSEELLADKQGLKGRLRIGLLTQSAQPFLTRAIIAMKQAYPLVTLELMAGAPAELEAALSRGVLHFILGPLARAQGNPDLVGDPIPAERAMVVAGGGVEEGAGAASWCELVQQAWCLPPAGKPLRTLFDTIVAREGLQPPASIVELPPTFLAEAIVRETGFYMLVPGSVAQRWSARGGIRIVDIDIPPIEESMGIIWHSGLITPTGRLFLSFLRGEMGRED